jgi:hypothetical protein
MRKSMSHQEMSDPEIERMLEGMEPAGISPQLREELRERLTSGLKPVRPMSSTGMLFVRFLAAFTLLAAACIAVIDVSGFTSLTLSRASGVVFILAAGAVSLSMSLALQMSPVNSQRSLARLATAGFGLGFLTGAALLFPWRGLDGFVENGWPCLATGLAVAVPTAVLFGVMSRHAAPLSAGTYGSTLGAIAALLGITVLQLRCLHQYEPHVMIWHGGVWLTATLGGFWIAQFTKWVFRRPT